VAALRIPKSQSSATVLRGILLGSYWAVAFCVVFVFYLHDTFCVRPGSRNYLFTVALLASALTGWDFVASVVGALAEKMFKRPGVSLLLTTLIVVSGLIYVPFWIYKGYGNFRFENTWADVSCFFTEMGNTFGFLFVVTPLLTLTTILREIVLLRQQLEGPLDLFTRDKAR
jgi:hypothetical protein